MALERGEGSTSCPGRSLPARKDPVPIVQEAGWVPGLVWTGAENLGPTGIRSLDRPAHSQLLLVCMSRVRDLAAPMHLGLINWPFVPLASRYNDYATRPTFHAGSFGLLWVYWQF